MFYIIETEEQFEKFSEYNFDESFVEFITKDDRVHYSLSPVSVVFIKPNRSKRGFVLPIDHSECFSLSLDKVIDLIKIKVKSLVVFDPKKTLYFIDVHIRVKSIKMEKYLEENVVIDDSSYNTPAHNHYYESLSYRNDINYLIPISKHAEKWNNLVRDNKLVTKQNKGYHKFYNSFLPKVFSKIETCGISVDQEVLDSHFTLKQTFISTENGLIYSNYNIYTATGRPSNAFNGINFAALNKGDGSRGIIKPSLSNMLVEMDYKAYHPRILSKIIGYDLDQVDDVYEYLACQYYQKDTFEEHELDNIKEVVFKCIYTDGFKDITVPFFKKVQRYKNQLWDEYTEKGYVKTHISKRPIYNIKNKTQLLPYLLQSFETERNVFILDEINRYIDDGYSRGIILYSYDSFLLDLHNDEDLDHTIQAIKNIAEQDGFPVNVTLGNSYDKMRSYFSNK